MGKWCIWGYGHLLPKNVYQTTPWMGKPLPSGNTRKHEHVCGKLSSHSEGILLWKKAEQTSGPSPFQTAEGILAMNKGREEKGYCKSTREREKAQANRVSNNRRVVKKGHPLLGSSVMSTVFTCLLKCSSCMACVHSFDCTCLDYSTRGVVCTHIRAVCLINPILWSEVCDDDGKGHDIEIIEEKRQGLASLVPISKELHRTRRP